MNSRKYNATTSCGWFMLLLLSASLAGCGSGDDSSTNSSSDNSSDSDNDSSDSDNDSNNNDDNNVSNPGPAGASPNLGTAGVYAVFASDAEVTLAADVSVVGDVGLNPAGACNNCVIGVTVTGAIHNGDAEAIQAQIDFKAAYTDAANRTTNACAIVDGELSSAQADCSGVTPGPIYGPGLYRTANPIGVGVGFTITLDAQGNADAVFIFQTDTAITTGTSSNIVLAGGTQAKNVWWVAGSAATLGVSSIFKGTVIANGAAVQVLGGTSLEPTLVEGRLFSSAAAVNVDTFTTVTTPQ